MHADRSARCDVETAKAYIDDSDVVSFDFFDTLVTRHSASPDSVQRYVGYRLERENGALNDFFVRRKGAERAARTRHPEAGDVDLAAIYTDFPVDSAWTPQVVARARALEVEIDAQFLLVRDNAAELLRYAKAAHKRVIVVSDSYFSGDFFQTAVRRFGWAGLIDEFYVSSEKRARKSDGALWSRVTELEGLHAKRFVHFGDNPHSDITTAQSVGLRCMLLPNPAVLAAERGIVHRADENWRADILLGPLFARLGNDPFAAAPITIDDERTFGYLVYGPIFLAFFAWLVTSAHLRQMNRLFFAAREGYFLQRLYDRLIARFDFRGLPASQYLPISRRAVIMASQAVNFDPAAIMGSGDFRGDLELFLRARLGLDLEQVRLPNRPIQLPEDNARISDILNDLRPVIVEQAERERVALLAYCENAGIARNRQTGLVDIGYSGTIQKGLQDVIGRPLHGFYMATTPRASAVRNGGGRASGCFSDERHGVQPAIMIKMLLMEALLTAPHGQLARFEMSDFGIARPVYLADEFPQANFLTLKAMFEGATAYCENLIQAASADVLTAILPAKNSVFDAVDAVFDGRLKVSESIQRVLSVEDSFCGSGRITFQLNKSPTA